jgi:vitamin B12 transporter
LKKIALASFAGALVSMHAYAQENIATTDDVVVTASRTPQKITDVLGDVTVITEQEIRQAGQTSLAELLSAQPGLEISHNGGIGKDSDVYIRGANSTHSLILVDGMRISSATRGTTALQHLPLAQIERIEILRGPASSLYGADAIGGVIQIFTKSPQGAPRVNAAIGLGTYGTVIGEAGIGGRIENTSFSLQAGSIKTNGFSAIANPTASTYNPDDDGYRNFNISGKVAQHFDDRHEIGATAFISEGRNFFDSGNNSNVSNPSRRFNFYSDQTLSSFTLYSKNQFTDRWLSTLRVGRSIDDLMSLNRNTPNTLTTRSLFKTTQDQYSWQNDIATPIGLLTLGAERIEQEVKSTTNFAVTERSIDSWLAGWLTEFGNHRLQLNFRNDDNSQFGDHTTGAINYGFQITQNWRASAGYGTAFNAPTFNQLYAPLANSFIGNPTLKPEKAHNREIGLHYAAEKHQASAIYYQNKVTDLIVNTGSPVQRPVNISEADLSGLTLTYQGEWAGLNLGASADLQRPEDDATGNMLPRRAKKHATLSLSKQLGDWEIGSSLEGSSRRFNNAANTPAMEMDGYTIANVFANYRINRDWSLSARVNNVFDRDYELAKNFGTPGTNALLTLRYASNP